MKSLTETIPYRRTVWVKNFAKTVTTTTLVSSGIGLIITGLTNRLHNRGYSDVELVLGVLAIIIAIIIVIIIDRWAEQKKREELEAIETQIDEKAGKIAQDLIIKHMEQYEK